MVEPAEQEGPEDAAHPAPPRPAEHTTSTPTAPSKHESLVGWWRSDSLCLELFENGDFELSVLGRPPKVLIMGAARTTGEDASATTLELEVRRIWRARFTGPCRKVHEFGGFAESEQTLGLRFEPGARAMVTITRTAPDALQVCGQDCATLRRETPELGARWRQAGFENPQRPERAPKPGELLELDLDGAGGHVWVAQEGGGLATVYGTTTAVSTGPDRFSITFRPNGRTGQEKGAVLSLWGTELREGATVVLSAHRLPRQRLEVCEGEHCVTLERQFDADHYDLR